MLEIDSLIDKEYSQEAEITKKELDDIIASLQLYTNDPEMLTKTYTNILMDDNVVYIMTRLSQNIILNNHFPELYEKNKYGESVINCQQNTPYHRYGVFKHTLYTIENVGKDSLKFNAQELKLLKWTMFLHDIGKPKAKMINGSGSDSFAGHEEISEKIATDILDRFWFTEEEKKVILTLIKYHDKYLNEGDLTYDNLSFLAKELDNKKDLFQLLIEVKCADNKAKSIDVYNKFSNTQNKYYEFANDYFNNQEDNRTFGTPNKNTELYYNLEYEEEKEENISKVTTQIYEEGGSDKDITEKLIQTLCKDIAIGKRLKCYYQPIIDLKNVVVEGYEVYYKIITEEDFSYKQLIRKAKEFEKYDKLQQMLFINALNDFKGLGHSSDLTEYINIDARSYKNYVNKSRVFDAVEGRKVVIEFNNFETLNDNVLKELVEELHKAKAKVGIDNFESSNKEVKDIDKIEPKVVKYRLENMDDNTTSILKQLSVYCIARSIRFIVFGIDTKEKLDYVMNVGIRYVQGEYFGKPMDNIGMTRGKLEELINQEDEELIV